MSSTSAPPFAIAASRACSRSRDRDEDPDRRPGARPAGADRAAGLFVGREQLVVVEPLHGLELPAGHGRVEALRSLEVIGGKFDVGDAGTGHDVLRVVSISRPSVPSAGLSHRRPHSGSLGVDSDPCTTRTARPSSSAPRARRSASSAAALSGVPATTLGGVAIRAAVERAGLDPATVQIDDVLMGQVLQAGSGPGAGPPGGAEGRPPRHDQRHDHQPRLRLGAQGDHARRRGDPGR